MNILDKITIIIPAHNRPEYLKRLLRYYLNSDIHPKIIVADSSVIPFDDELNEMAFFLNLTYLKFPSEVEIEKKFLQVLNKVTTEYVVFCSDDDFVALSAIVDATGFMEENPDYSVVLGLTFHYFLSKRRDGEIEFNWGTNYGFVSITSDNPSERLKAHLENYRYPTFYGVHKTAHLRYIFEETIHSTSHVRMAELLLSALNSIYGKIGILPIFYSLREAGDPAEKKPYDWSWEHFLSQDCYEEEYKRALECLGRNLQKQTGLSFEEAKQVAANALDGYWNFWRTRTLHNERWRFFVKIRKLLISFLDKINLKSPARLLKRQASAATRGIFGGVWKRDGLDTDNCLRNDTNFQKNFNLIRESVMTHRVNFDKYGFR